ncbi:S-layer homology domain-containing protein, partial [Paenibacillus sp. N3.4]|uniref:S-layer homology domain-containing protein n=1 Tax=Paenibacillus sp. N3.4 TaxID=2603222 RepID=UPI0011C8B697
MRNKLSKKLISIIVMTCLLFSSFGVAFGAATFTVSDIQGHWAENNISKWIDKGLIKGYDDGSFKPENKITRAEFIALVNRSFGFTETAVIAFSDVASDHWAHAEVEKAVKAGFITGYEDGTIGVSKPISRQEVAVIVSRLLKLEAKASASTAAFLDASKMASWGKDAIGEVVASEIMNGYEADHSFKPEASITRAEAVVTLDRANTVRANAAQTVSYNAAGNYGPITGIETVNKNVVVNAAGVTLQNMVINGDLLLGEGIGNGDAFLENVKVTGKVTVQGGGENSIHFNNSVLVDIIIDKKAGTGIVRIVSEGTTTVALVSIKSPAILKETNSTGTGFGIVNITSSLPAGSKVTLAGSFDTVNVSSQQIQIDVPEGTIQNVNAKSTATGMSLNLSKDATINSLVLDAVVKMLGKGTIVLATINTEGSTFETPAIKTTQPTATPTPTSSGSESGSGPSPTSPPAVSKTTLTSAIVNATTLLEAHPVGKVNGDVSQEAYDAYHTAITAATAIRDGASSTQAQVDEAVTTLDELQAMW